MPKKNTGIPYERLTQKIFDSILAQSEVKTIDVKHNVVIKGKTVDHQIDVYWEFELGGEVYRTVVQAKDWSQRVALNQLLMFKGVLDDLPGQPKGIFVTRTGYQAGARQFAEKHGIELYELRPVEEADLAGRLRTILLAIHLDVPRVTNVRFEPDNEWAVAEFKRLALPEDAVIEAPVVGLEDEIYLYDESGNPLSSLYEVLSDLVPLDGGPLNRKEKRTTFDVPTFIKVPHNEFPWLKLNGLKADVEVQRVSKEVQIGGDNFAEYVLHRLRDGLTKFVGDGGNRVAPTSR